VNLQNIDVSRGAKLDNETFALALELSISVNSTGMSWQHVCLSLKSYVVDVDNQAITSCPCQVMLVMALPSQLATMLSG
jgi:hypothetical protein